MINGRYKHFKGGFCDVLGLAIDADTDEVLVVYRATDTNLWFTHSAKSFIEQVEHNGLLVPRFELVERCKNDGLRETLEAVLNDWQNDNLNAEEAWHKVREALREGANYVRNKI